ncbi:prepilin-type N-terminal cleavage/methylation domain-containing protein [Candidatus Parcubacteria bacterium]|nr:prepilin-type N-terminal cleavage/methylation domain-containing protein [Candidatus Parcubacteria bacterium]
MNEKAFTLIELLVVISIIGVIASIVLVSFSGSRDEAKLARGQQFDAQINHALGAYAVGIWDFEDQNNPTADRSGYGNHGTIYGNPVFVNSEVYPGTKALQFDGAQTQYVKSSNLVVVPQDGTIEGWIKGKLSSQTGQNIYPFGFNHVSLLGPSGTTTERAGIITGTGSSYDYVNWGDKNLYNGKWHHYVVSWVKKGENNYQFHLYIDGKQIGNPKVSTRHPAGQMRNIQVGVAWGTYGAHTGEIDNVKIYSEALSASQIQQHFAASAAQHGIALK